jgi:hypothetical protein
MTVVASMKRFRPPLIALGVVLLWPWIVAFGERVRGEDIVLSRFLTFGCVLWLIVCALRPYWRPRWIVALVSTLVIGAAAFVAVRTFEQRRVAEDKSISTYQIHAAVDQLFHEHPDRVFITYDDLVGPRRYLKAVNPVAGEDYHELFPVRADTELMSVTMGDDRKNIVVFDAKKGGIIVVHESPEGKLTGAVAAYQAWLAAQDRSDGVHVTTPPAGGRFETTWRGGVPDGPFRATYADGKLWAEAAYVRGAPAGRHVVYDRTGKIIYETIFVPWRKPDAVPPEKNPH